MKNRNAIAIVFAVLAAALYAVSTPVSKIMLSGAPPIMVAAFLYLGAGIGMFFMMLVRYAEKSARHEERLTKKDAPYALSMVVLDIIAPIFLMYGLKITSAANTALLNNFEIVATSSIALLFFREKVSLRLWAAITLVTLASILLSLDGSSALDALSFSKGSLLVLSATICWGLENNCTRQIADKDPMEIVTIKGFGSGFGAFVIAFCFKESLPSWDYIAIILLLGFVSYGLSIYFYTYAQRIIGAAKTSTYYACAPFIGTFLSVLLLGEPVGWILIVAFIVMAAGCYLAARDS